MMFSTYFRLGLEHILDLQGADHMAFIVVLCAIFLLADWRRVILLATAFTLGHSLTLALAALDMIPVNISLVETLIPITIMITAVFNMPIQGAALFCIGTICWRPDSASFTGWASPIFLKVCFLKKAICSFLFYPSIWG